MGPRAYILPGGRVSCAQHLTPEQRTGAISILPSERWDEYPVCDRCGAVHSYVAICDCGPEIIKHRRDCRAVA